jgi:hypothetical protein
MAENPFGLAGIISMIVDTVRNGKKNPGAAA